ncbi:hypothetical protein U1Q18_031039, partial [Sarracenia purpurea var. burkii]
HNRTILSSPPSRRTLPNQKYKYAGFAANDDLTTTTTNTTSPSPPSVALHPPPSPPSTVLFSPCFLACFLSLFFSLTNQFHHALPGLGIALVTFAIYLVGEAAYNKIYAPLHSPSHSPSSYSQSH